MKLTMLGTGNAMVTECYNTCFTLQNEAGCFLVDAGGGNTVLQRLKQAGLDWKSIRDIFVTHKHIDHILGVVWLMRMICQHMNQGQYEGEARIYAHAEVAQMLRTLAQMLLQKKQAAEIDNHLHIIEVQDGETRTVLGCPVTFFDIHSTKAKQFGFSMQMEDGNKLTCCGDEPYNEAEEVYARGSKWLMLEAFCLASQADVFKPYEKHHSTVADACTLAQQLDVQNLILYHTEEKNLANRKALYTEEGSRYFQGNLFVPDDLESFQL